MYQKKKICSAYLQPETCETDLMQIDYYLTSQICASDGATPTVVYGIESESIRNGRQGSRATTLDISPNQNEVESIIEKFSRNTVTPITLRDVVEDYLCMV